MYDTYLQWASYWDGNFAWAAIAALFVISGLVILPRPAICIVAGLTFGLAGIPLALGASVVGSLIAFIFARYFFRDRFLRMIERHPKARLLAQAIDDEGWRLLFLLRLASPVPGPVSNYAFGLSSMNVVPYVLVTLIGIAPQVIAFVYLGALGRVAMNEESLASAKLAFGVAGLIVLMLVIAMVTRRVRQMVRTKLDATSRSS